MKVIVVANIPDELVADWLKHLQKFTGGDVKILISDPNKSPQEIEELLRDKTS